MEHQWYVLQVFSNFEHKVQRTLTDRIEITINTGENLAVAVSNNLNYICSETLADNLRINTDSLENMQELELVKGVKTYVSIKRKN